MERVYLPVVAKNKVFSQEVVEKFRGRLPVMGADGDVLAARYNAIDTDNWKEKFNLEKHTSLEEATHQIS